MNSGQLISSAHTKLIGNKLIGFSCPLKKKKKNHHYYFSDFKFSGFKLDLVCYRAEDIHISGVIHS